MTFSTASRSLLLLWVGIMTVGCSRPFNEIPKSTSGNTPKQYLVARGIKPSSLIGTFARSAEKSEPLIISDTVYVGSIYNQFLALRKQTGTIVWRKKIKGGVESSPQYFNEKIYFGANDGYFYCLVAATGRTVWTYKTDAEILSKPLIKGGIVFFLTAKNELYALRADSGKWVWYYNRGYIQKISVRGSSSPVYHDGKIYIGFSDGSFFALNAFTGAVIWQRILSQEEKFIDIDATAVVDNNIVYVGSSDGFVYALNNKTGETIWNTKLEGGGGMTTDGQKIYLSSSSGKVIALKCSNGKREWEFDVKVGIPSDPILVEDQIIFGTTESYVYGLSTENGNEIWRYATDSGVSVSPVFDVDRLYLYTHLSAIHVIDPFYLLSGG